MTANAGEQRASCSQTQPQVVVFDSAWNVFVKSAARADSVQTQHQRTRRKPIPEHEFAQANRAGFDTALREDLTAAVIYSDPSAERAYHLIAAGGQPVDAARQKGFLPTIVGVEQRQHGPAGDA